MPAVDVVSRIFMPIEDVWEAILDIESFPDYMENVLSVEVREFTSDRRRRVSAWTALLKGSVLEWVEDEQIDLEGRLIHFAQIDGDLDVFQGTWSVDREDGCTIVQLKAEFDIGIPLLADMLNPVAARALRDNQEQMLRSIERRVLTD